jgi:phage terminase large subunit
MAPDEKTRTVKEIGFTKVFEKNQKSKKTVIVNVGGARSSKSHSICQLLIMKLVQEKNKVFGITRKTFPALRMTTMQMFFDLLKDYGVYQDENHNKTFNTYVHGTNRVQFFGLDEADKIKSTEFNYIWMEEANEFTYDDYTNLKLRLSGKVEPGELNHLYLSLNPTDANGWIPVRAVKEADTELIKSNFLDNPYLSSEYVKTLTDMMYYDENYYRIYALGEWGKLEGRIFTNYEVLPELPKMEGAKWAYGLDYGLVNPSAVTKVYLFKDNFYIEEILYKSGLTVRDIIEKFTHEARGDIYADPSAKMMTAEIAQAGFSAYDGHKGVKESIDVMQRTKLYIPQSSANLIKELQGYCWKKDPNDPEHFLSEPIKINDHLVDSARYAIWGLTERYGFATKRPGSLKPLKTLTFR